MPSAKTHTPKYGRTRKKNATKTKSVQKKLYEKTLERTKRNGNDDSFLKTIHVFDCYSVHNSTDNPTYRRATSNDEPCLYICNWNVCTRISHTFRPARHTPTPLRHTPFARWDFYILLFLLFASTSSSSLLLPPLSPPSSPLPLPVNALSALLLFLAFNSQLNRKSTVCMDMHGIDVLVVAGALWIEINVVMYNVLLSADIVVIYAIWNETVYFIWLLFSSRFAFFSPCNSSNATYHFSYIYIIITCYDMSGFCICDCEAVVEVVARMHACAALYEGIAASALPYLQKE